MKIESNLFGDRHAPQDALFGPHGFRAVHGAPLERRMRLGHKGGNTDRDMGRPFTETASQDRNPL